MHSPGDIELALRRSPLFCDVATEVIQAISLETSFRTYSANEYLFHAGATADYLYVLMEGAVKMTAGPLGGRESVIELMQPVDCFLMAAVLSAKPYLLSAQAVGEVEVLTIPAELLRGVVSTEPQLALTMIASLANQYRQMVRHVKDLRLRTAVQRLGIYLIGLADKQGGSKTLSLPFVKRLIAARLNMTPENMSRAIVALRDEGVDVIDDEVHLRDIDALRRFCQVDTLLDELDEEFFVLTER
ncbi:MAG: cyclic nucleotide-binding domain-containing protein [Gammaproteobacteria bacterium]|nr:cyclic nucleotide-binding domain-containing protein [Gammaproteobacteria bacterium]MCW8840162.1 cyclic nucleotide-binding domain-containing protein [Gammaproteobacteria bacterium]MCW8928241.1 cyclic nucleotide-binding domain-containing protein [Gammaproteobacteria bacterium]MCW8957583.1 cyclic nucleotide-binding domain-containing protein [Gammaproteobacteria bacterium]MCW8972067.1 cyclic nucleotide-binding domain-containing protein [Gammaproteobacteria bacterium]